MKTAILSSLVFAFVLSASPLLQAATTSTTTPAAEIRFDELLWREVRTTKGEALGAVSDLLVQMPAGRVVFIAVDPVELFERSRVIPPGILRLPADPKAPLEIDITLDRWLDAPRLNWDAELITKNAREGGVIYGFYQEEWQEPDKASPWGASAMADGTANPPARYVSLKQLLLEPAVAKGGERAGYIRDFLLDWAGKRTTHALISPQPVPLPASDRAWFAVPVTLLNPQRKEDALVINADAPTIRSGKLLAAGQKMPTSGAEIFQYPVPNPR
jgi:sporulation protein YlmC with PRC-barrel domain